jgi:hypothetical protein
MEKYRRAIDSAIMICPTGFYHEINEMKSVRLDVIDPVAIVKILLDPFVISWN